MVKPATAGIAASVKLKAVMHQLGGAHADPPAAPAPELRDAPQESGGAGGSAHTVACRKSLLTHLRQRADPAMLGGNAGGGNVGARRAMVVLPRGRSMTGESVRLGVDALGNPRAPARPPVARTRTLRQEQRRRRRPAMRRAANAANGGQATGCGNSSSVSGHTYADSARQISRARASADDQLGGNDDRVPVAERATNGTINATVSGICHDARTRILRRLRAQLVCTRRR